MRKYSILKYTEWPTTSSSAKRIRPFVFGLVDNNSDQSQKPLLSHSDYNKSATRE